MRGNTENMFPEPILMFRNPLYKYNRIMTNNSFRRGGGGGYFPSQAISGN